MLSIVAPIVTTFWFSSSAAPAWAWRSPTRTRWPGRLKDSTCRPRCCRSLKTCRSASSSRRCSDSHHHLRGHHRRLDDLRDLGGNVEPGSLGGRRPCVLGSGNGRHGHADLIYTGSGGIGKLQSFIVVTAVPVSLILLPSLWDAARITLLKGRGQAARPPGAIVVARLKHSVLNFKSGDCHAA